MKSGLRPFVAHTIVNFGVRPNMIDKKFVVIGGGTGSFSVLSGLKKYTSQITAIVTMADSGGSAKMERDEFGLLPSSDIRKSLIALADVSSADSLLLRKLFEYRYSHGTGLGGVTFGNLFLVALTKLMGSQEQAIEKAGELLRINGRVLPVSLDRIHLVATYQDGSEVVGEHDIDNPRHSGKVPITKLTTRPIAKVSQKAKEAIREADVIIVGPGGFYTTTLATLVVDGVTEAIVVSKAKKIFIMNLMTEWGQTYGFTAQKHLLELNKYLPLKNLGFVLINNAPIPSGVLARYKMFHAMPITNDLITSAGYTIVALDLLSRQPVLNQKGDTLKRSLIRHSPSKLARACLKVLNLI